MYEKPDVISRPEDSHEIKGSSVERFLNHTEQFKMKEEKVLHAILSGFAEKKLLPQSVLEHLDEYIRSVEDSLKSSGISEEEVGKLVKNIIKKPIADAVMAYRDSRFNIPNFAYLSMTLSEFASEARTEEDFRRSGMIFLDADGLKAVNDKAVTRHAAGDKYLHKVSRVLTNGETGRWLERQGIRVVPARRSGDEFMLAIQSRKGDLSKGDGFVDMEGNALSESLFSYIIKSIKREIYDLDMSDVMDFSNVEQRKEYSEIIAENEWPEGFTFHASISGGAATFMDVLDKIGSEAEELSKEEMRPSEISKKLVGLLIDAADTNMMFNKENDKKKRASSSSISERLMEKIYRTGRGDKADEAATLKEKIVELENRYSELQDRNKILEVQNRLMREELETLKGLKSIT